MELLSALATGWITLLFLALSWMVKGRLDRLELRFEASISELRSGLEDIRSEMHAGFRDVRSEIQGLRSEHAGEIGALRSDMTQVALALGMRPPETG